MREKWKLATNKKQVLILTITPEKWFTKKICQEFEVSEHLVRKAKKLRNEKGSRAKPDAKKGAITSRKCIGQSPWLLSIR